MPKLDIAVFAKQLREKRGVRGIRETATEIGVSSATLSRVENGNLPDLQRFAKICEWLGVDPADVLGLSTKRKVIASAAVHFRKDQTLNTDVAAALADMIMKAHRALQTSSK